MRVLFLSQIVPYPPHGGVLQRGYNLIRESSKFNQIHLKAFIHPDILNSEELINESRQVLSKFCQSIEYFFLWPKKSLFHRFSSLFISLFSRLPYSVHAHRSSAFQKSIYKCINTHKIELIHFDTIALSRFNQELIGIPKVLTHHNIESQLMERRGIVEKNPIAKFYLMLQADRLRKYEYQQCPRYDVNIMVSEKDRENIVSYVPNIATSTVPNGVDLDYFTPRNSSEEESALIYTGGMNMFANMDAIMFFLNEIWPLIVSVRPEVKFYAIGQDPPPELIEISNKDRRISVPGYVDDVRPFIAKSSVYIVPLRVGGGTRLKVLDAMAQGKAIVCTSLGCEGLDVSPGSDLEIGDAPSVFAEKTINLLNNARQREFLGRNARKLVERKYSWEFIGKKLQNSYQTAIQLKKGKKV